MRILHLVTLSSPDGAYGGPLTVALNQSRALISAGHEVTLVAGARGYGQLPVMLSGVPARLFRAITLIPKAGFAGLSAPSLMFWLMRNARRFDVVHVHYGRDLIAGPVPRLLRSLGVPYVIQTHGMVTAALGRVAKTYDRVFTEGAFRDASVVFALTPRERERFGERLRAAANSVEILPNGIRPVPSTLSSAKSPHDQLEVLFLARLHPRKRAAVFAEVGVSVTSRLPGVRFSICGPDEGDLRAVTSIINRHSAEHQVYVEGAVAPSDVIPRLRKADIYVLPSLDEPFGMTVIEAMACGKPVVISDSCGIAEQVVAGGAGIAVGPSSDSLSGAIERLISDAKLRSAMGRNAVALVEDKFGIESVAHRLARVYDDVVAGSPHRSRA